MDDPNPVSIPVTVSSCTNAAPARVTPNLSFFLPNIDLTVVFMVDSVYFYSSGADQAPDSLLKALQDSMVHFFPFAGRLQFDQATQRLQLHANASGVPFAVAAADGISLGDLGDLSVPNPSYRNLVYTPDNVNTFSDWPLFTVQVTRFTCGGFALGFSVNHALCDGFGIISFMHHFTRTARGDSAELPELNLDRTILAARSPPSPTLDFGDVYYKSREIPATQSFSTVEDMLSANLASANFVVSDLQSKVIQISGREIEYLKSLATSDGVVSKCSTFDVLAAFVWKLRTVAVEMPAEHESVMFMAVDIGGKVSPPLPPGFFGNRACPVSVKLTTEQLLSQPLSYCVKLIQETLAGVTDEYVRSWIDWSEIHRGIPKFNGGFYLSSWWKFPFYNMDFGWGKPMYMGPVLTQRVEFVLILPVSPTRANGGVDLLLTLSPEHMAKFQTLVKYPRM